MADMDKAIGDLNVATVVINVQDMTRAADFWAAALGYVRREKEWDPEFMMLVDPVQRRLPVSLPFTAAPPQEPVRGQLDLYTHEQARHLEGPVGPGGQSVQ